MQTARQMAERVRGFISNIKMQSTKAIVLNERPLILTLQEQLLKGEDGTGNQLPPYRSEAYADYKLSKNPLGVTDLKDTGSFYQHMRLVIGGGAFGGGFSIISTDDKYAKLVKKYGYQIMDLNTESQEKYFRLVFQPTFVRLASDYTGIGIVNR